MKTTEKQICLYLPEQLLFKIKALAEKEYSSVNALIRSAIIEYLKTHDTKEE